MPFYTGRGDSGDTSLFGGKRIPKGDPIFDLIGDVDELNSSVGVALYYTHDDMVRGELRTVQNNLFIVGAGLASLQNDGVKEGKLDGKEVARLEEAMKDIERRVPPPNKFVIPGGCEGAVHLHAARAAARRAERSAIRASNKYKVDAEALRYLNRLSSYLFAAAIYLNYIEGIKESHPAY
jgi:cob(I)alamin adenosyltransferase